VLRLGNLPRASCCLTPVGWPVDGRISSGAAKFEAKGDVCARVRNALFVDQVGVAIELPRGVVAVEVERGRGHPDLERACVVAAYTSIED